MDLETRVSDEEILDVLGKAYRGEYSTREYRGKEVGRVRSELEKRLEERTFSDIVRNFLVSVGIDHLDKIEDDKVHKKTNFWPLLGIKNEGKRYHKVRTVQTYLANNQVFSPSLRNYDNPADIIKEIVSRIWGKFRSYYFGNSLDPDVLKDNQDLLFEHNDYLRSLQHLDQIDTPASMRRGLWSLLGIQNKRCRPHIGKIQRELVELKRFPARLRDYKNPQEIIRYIVDKKSTAGQGKFKSFYFSPSLDPEILKDNIDLLFESNEDLNSIKHLDQITLKLSVKAGLWSLLGIQTEKERNPTIEEAQRGFVNLGRFSEDLGTYSSAERDLVFSDLLDKREPSSYYLSGSHQYLESNRRLFFASEQFHEYLEREKISLDDLSTVKTQTSRSIFKKYLGIDVGVVAGIEGTLVGTRKITSIWSEDEEERLLGEYRRIAGSFENGEAIEKLQENEKELQESFRRSIYAILMKLQHLGAIEFKTFGKSTGQPSDVILYPFPQFHERDLSGFSLRTKNSAYLLELGIVPDATAVASYLSPTEQLVHATVPIHYKGIELTNYNETEQRLLGLVNTYIKHFERFAQDTKKNSLELLADSELDKDIRILAVANGDNVYTQVMHRHEGVIPDEVAISTGKGSEIYFFRREEIPTYKEARGWPAKQLNI